MSLYWNYDSIPEFQGLSPEQEQHLKAQARRASWRMPVMWVATGLHLAMGLIGLLPILMTAFPDSPLVRVPWMLGWILGGPILHRLITINAIRPVVALHRQAMEAKPSKDGSYYVPPAF